VVTFFLRPVGGESYRVNGAVADIVDPAATAPSDADAGLVRYDWEPADVAAPGDEMLAWFHLTYPGGATQDTPEFAFDLVSHFDGTLGKWISPASLKDFTGLDELKVASDEWLASNVIPRAEAWLLGFGPFDSDTCPQLTLAAHMIAEGIFERVNPLRRNRALAQAGGVKSESIGDYSYTLGELSGSGGSTPWMDLMQEVDQLLNACRLFVDDTFVGGYGFGSEGDVFVRLPTGVRDRNGLPTVTGYDPYGRPVAGFDVGLEIETIRGWCGGWR
jgi:hypothetical protein